LKWMLLFYHLLNLGVVGLNEWYMFLGVTKVS